MPAASNPTRGKGGGLSRKVGPLPLWAWALMAAAVLGYFLFFRKKTAAVQQTSTQTPPSADQQAGLVPSAGSSGDNGAATAAMLQALGNENDQLIGGLLQGQQALVAEGQSIVALAQGDQALAANAQNILGQLDSQLIAWLQQGGFGGGTSGGTSGGNPGNTATGTSSQSGAGGQSIHIGPISASGVQNVTVTGSRPLNIDPSSNIASVGYGPNTTVYSSGTLVKVGGTNVAM